MSFEGLEASCHRRRCRRYCHHWWCHQRSRPGWTVVPDHRRLNCPGHPVPVRSAGACARRPDQHPVQPSHPHRYRLERRPDRRPVPPPGRLPLPARPPGRPVQPDVEPDVAPKIHASWPARRRRVCRHDLDQIFPVIFVGELDARHYPVRRHLDRRHPGHSYGHANRLPARRRPDHCRTPGGLPPPYLCHCRRHYCCPAPAQKSLEPTRLPEPKLQSTPIFYQT